MLLPIIICFIIFTIADLRSPPAGSPYIQNMRLLPKSDSSTPYCRQWLLANRGQEPLELSSRDANWEPAVEKIAQQHV
jgi:hypothetical protein